MIDLPTAQPVATLAATWSRRARGLVRRDPRVASVAGVVGMVTILMLGRVVITGSDNPAVARASTVGAHPMFGPTGRPSAAVGGQDGAPTLPDHASSAMREWLAGPIAPMGRNLFAIKLDYYPQDGASIDQTPRAPTGNGFWDKLAKSMASRADQRKERQILVENLQLQAMQLRLQSTVMSATPSALINGSVFREGDVVASFRVLTIEARRIVVEREGIKLEIPMY